ncbi:MAG: endolytic transglycosylase MltG, partial [Gammaproteobacteria bacterium]|nr:endolytic transglycosylase MltG [Gammaproteobacteria bacterium]
MKINRAKADLLTMALLIVIMLLVGVFTLTKKTMGTANSLQEELVVEIKQGATIRSLVKQLKQHDLISQPMFLILWTRLNGDAKRLQVGEYVVRPGATLSDLMNDITSGRVRQYSLKLLEGWTFKEFMSAIESHPAISHELNNLSQKEILERLEIDYEHPEGLFFPETYNIHKNISDVNVLKRAHEHMKKHLHRLWEERDQALPFESPYEALILASIVEKESAVEDERALIAGAFVNRLRKNMR